MQETGWEATRRPLVARLAGLAALGVVVIALLPGTLGGPFFDDNVSTPQILDWVHHHIGALSVQGFVSALSATCVALFVWLLVSVSASGSGLAARIATGSVAAYLAIDWVQAGVYYALADAGGRQQADAGVVGLFSLAKTLTFADGFTAAIAMTAVCVLARGSRALPAPIVWLGLVNAVFHLVSVPAQLVINHSAGGVTGPIGVILVLLWLLSTAIVLLVRPVRRTAQIAPVPAPAG